MILAAVVMAGGAALVANKWLQAQVLGGVDMQVGMVPVAAAAVQIPFGQKIEPAHIKLLQLPEKALPAGAFRDQESVIGKIAAQAIYPVAVNEVIGVAGFLLPGNRVDVLATKKAGNQGVKASTLLQDIKVLAVDQTSSTDKNDPVVVRAVTLEVNPQQAEILIKATQEGKVQLSLRNPLDEIPVTSGQETPQQKEKPAAISPTGKRVVYKPKVTVIRGTQVSTSEVRK